MRHLNNTFLAIASFAALAVCGSAHAQIVPFIGTDAGANMTDPRPNSNAAATAFDLAAGALGTETLINFESSSAGSFASLAPASGVTITGSDYFSSNQSIQNAPGGSPSALYGYNTTTGGAKYLELYGGSATFTFAQPVEGFGAYFTGVQISGETINFNDGTSESVNIPNPGSGVSFVGFTDAKKNISSITVNAGGDIIGVDDVRFLHSAAAPTTTPEPGAIALIATMGLSGAGLLARRKHVRSAK